jgi:NTP pyrophosphatase (non-canonical NTP hydrolase)
MNNLNQFCRQIHEANKLKGFDESKENIGQSLMLIVSELSEALEAHRKSNFADKKKFDEMMMSGVVYEHYFENAFKDSIKDTFDDEIADTVIRCFSLCGALKIDIDWHIEQKLKYNETRSFKHGKKY